MSKEYTRALSILGSIPVAGPIIFFDDFIDPIKWVESGDSGDTIFEHDPSIVFHGNNSLYMKSRTTNAAEADEIIATRTAHLLPSKTVTLTLRFRSEVFDSSKYLIFRIYFYDRTNQHIASIYYEHATGIWAYLDSASVLQTMPDLTRIINPQTWHALSLRVDFSTDTFKSFRIDQDLSDLSNIPLRVIESAANARLETILQLETIAAAPTDINYSQVLLHEF